MTIGAGLAQFARSKPYEAAIVCDGAAVSWSELEASVAAYAADLDARTPAGCGVALLLPNSAHLLALFLAAARTGREAQVLDPHWPPALRDSVIAALKPGALYFEPALAWSPAPRAVDVDTRAPLPRRPPAANAAAEPDPETSFYVGFTSGSTGEPKGYRRHHSSWTESFRADGQEFGLTDKDVVLAPGAMTHSLFLYAAIHALQIGATLVMCRTFRPDAALEQGRARRASALYAAPTQLRMLADAGGPPAPHVRWVLSSGAKWFVNAETDLRRLFPNARFAEFYGASELSFVTVRKADEACPPESVGRPFPGVRITIRDDAGRALPCGEIGRIFVESPFLFTDYALGGASLTRHGDALCVGDLGWMDENGFLTLAGRENRMIVTSGKNVYPEEVERAFAAHPAVRAAAVFGAPDPQRGERLVALLSLDAQIPVTRAQLSRHARTLLPLPLVPRVLATPTRWRWTASGKTDFAALKRDWDEGDWELLP